MEFNKIKNKGLKFSCTLAVLVSLMLSQIAFAARPTEHCFGVKHPNMSYSCLGGRVWTVSALDTMSYVKDIHSSLDNNGYYNQYYFSNNNATAVANSIGNDAIFYINSHGGAGLVCCPYYDSGSSSWKMTLLTGTNTKSESIAVALQTKYGSTTDKLKKVRFAYFGSCYSAKTASTTDGWGNLLDTVTGLGVDCALGFTGTITVSKEGYFAKRLITYYGMDPNNTVSACAASSKADTYNKYGDYGGVDKYVIN